jgi:hypothetical protein
MSWSLKDKIWPLFGRWEDKRDSYKVGGKGINQRYNEILADEFDTETLPYIENLVSNLMDPDTLLDRFIPLWEDAFNTPIFDEDLDLRRKVLRYSVQLNKVAGTELGYKFLFRQIGIDCQVLELHNYSSFDIGKKFDNPFRTLDGSPEYEFQTPYKLILSGQALLPEQIENIISVVVKANEPVDAKYVGYVYTTLDVPEFFNDTFFRNDFFN